MHSPPVPSNQERAQWGRWAPGRPPTGCVPQSVRLSPQGTLATPSRVRWLAALGGWPLKVQRGLHLLSPHLPRLQISPFPFLQKGNKTSRKLTCEGCNTFKPVQHMFHPTWPLTAIPIPNNCTQDLDEGNYKGGVQHNNHRTYMMNAILWTVYTYETHNTGIIFPVQYSLCQQWLEMVCQ